jgi:1-acyl-sn-glycerol-3-phosphate acyltransferase
MALAPCTFLAKAEVARWPLIGWGARVAGTVFVDRSSPESRAASRETLKQRVHEGARILVFAEGTTTPRGEVHPLKPGMFHEAAEAGLPIQLISLEFERDEHAWVGDTPLWPHFVSVFGRRHTRAHITVHSELLRGDDAHTLREQAEAWLKDQANQSRG